MHKWLATFAILLTLGAGPIFGRSPASDKAKAKHAKHSQDQPADANPTTAPAVQSTTTNTAASANSAPAASNPAGAAQNPTAPPQAQSANVVAQTSAPLRVEAQIRRGWMDWLGWLLEAALVGVVGAGVWAAGKSLRLIEQLLVEIKAAGVRADRIVDHAGRQSEAALLSARSAQRSERAWIVITVDSPERDRFIFRARNVGKTPARIGSIGKFNSAVDTVKSKLKIAPEFERGEGLAAIQPFFLPPTANCILFEYTLAELGVTEAARKSATIYSYGRVVYSDATDATALHETRWFYVKPPAEGTMPFADPQHPEYNSYA
jgi:hypothetical protein